MRLRSAVAVAVLVSTFSLAAQGCPPPDPQPKFPIHAAFYYPWFPEGWNQQGFNPFTNYHPSLGYYDGSSASVIANHIAAMRYAGQDVGIASWWGQGTPTDTRVPLLLNGANSTDFRWSLYYEPESLGQPTVAKIRDDLGYIDQRYGKQKSYLRHGGHPVLFVYDDGSDTCSMVNRWEQANSDNRFYLVLKVFPGYLNCASQPDGWHQYAPAVATDSQPGQSFSISPGFYKKGEASPRLARNLTRWQSNVQAMHASGEPWQLMTTFNEWGEGTSVESATEWATSSGFGSYLDVLHQEAG